MEWRFRDFPSAGTDSRLALRSVLAPTFSPGIMYNSIKAGLAVDYPIFDANFEAALTDLEALSGDQFLTTASPKTAATAEIRQIMAFDLNAGDFIDITALNSDGTTTNLGLGLRHRPDDVSMVGGNVFWDYRMTDYSDAHSRLGLGGEYFWKDFEFRNNWYMSITDEKDVTVKGASYKERVVPGWDVEVGYRLPNNPELAFFVRGFNWDYKHTQDNSGLEGAISWQATPYVGLEAWVSNEISAASTTVNTSLPGTDETFFGLRMNITGNPVKFERSNYKKNMITQMTQPVKRKYDVLLERSSGTFQNRAKGN